MNSKDYNRQQNGRFGPGNDGGPGARRQTFNAHAQQLFAEELGDKGIRTAAQNVNAGLSSDDKGEKRWATEMVFKYAIPPAPQHIAIEADEPTRYDLELPRIIGDESDDLPALPAPDESSADDV